MTYSRNIRAQWMNDSDFVVDSESELTLNYVNKLVEVLVECSHNGLGSECTGLAATLCSICNVHLAHCIVPFFDSDDVTGDPHVA